jgi:hypothetical protein
LLRGERQDGGQRGSPLPSLVVVFFRAEGAGRWGRRKKGERRTIQNSARMTHRAQGVGGGGRKEGSEMLGTEKPTAGRGDQNKGGARGRRG